MKKEKPKFILKTGAIYHYRWFLTEQLAKNWAKLMKQIFKRAIRKTHVELTKANEYRGSVERIQESTNEIYL